MKSPLPVPMNLTTLSPTRQVLSSCEPLFSLPCSCPPEPPQLPSQSGVPCAHGGWALWDLSCEKPQAIPIGLVGLKLYCSKVIAWACCGIKVCGQLGSVVSLLCHVLPGRGRAEEVERFPLVNLTIIVCVWEHCLSCLLLCIPPFYFWGKPPGFCCVMCPVTVGSLSPRCDKVTAKERRLL